MTLFAINIPLTVSTIALTYCVVMAVIYRRSTQQGWRDFAVGSGVFMSLVMLAAWGWAI